MNVAAVRSWFICLLTFLVVGFFHAGAILDWYENRWPDAGNAARWDEDIRRVQTDALLPPLLDRLECLAGIAFDGSYKDKSKCSGGGDPVAGDPGETPGEMPDETPGAVARAAGNPNFVESQGEEATAESDALASLAGPLEHENVAEQPPETIRENVLQPDGALDRPEPVPVEAAEGGSLEAPEAAADDAPDARGDQTTEAGADDVPTPLAALSAPADGTIRTRDAVTVPPPVPVAPVPKPDPAAALATPIPGGRCSVLLVGDSLAHGLAISLGRRLRQKDGVDFSFVAKVSSGLNNPNVLNWEKTMRMIVRKGCPDIVLVMMGINDANNHIRDGSRLCVVGTPEWSDAYEKKVTEFLAIMPLKNTRVYWIGIPVVREDWLMERVLLANRVVKRACEKLPGCYFIDTLDALTDENQHYTNYLTEPDGGKVRVRAKDGIHFSSAGCDLLSEYVLLKMADIHWTSEGLPLAGDPAAGATGRAFGDLASRKSGRYVR